MTYIAARHEVAQVVCAPYCKRGELRGAEDASVLVSLSVKLMPGGNDSLSMHEGCPISAVQLEHSNIRNIAHKRHHTVYQIRCKHRGNMTYRTVHTRPTLPAP